MEFRGRSGCEMRLQTRTVILILVSLSWGGLLYAALFTGSRSDLEKSRFVLDRHADGGYFVNVVLTKSELEEVEKVIVESAGEVEDGEAWKREERVEKSDEMMRGIRHISDVIRRVGKQQSWRSVKKTVVTSQMQQKLETPSGGAGRFSIRPPFHFPMPHFSLPDEELLRSEWVTNLQAFLSGVQGKQVSLVTAGVEHQDVLLNWLISANLVATPPLENVLVLTLDKSLYDTISGRNISCLHVSETMVIPASAKVKLRFSQVHVVRLSVLRLITHYGFTVVNYDCDAIVLRNPQSVFDGQMDADLIGTFGKGPTHLYRKWGITLNTGVMLMRSTQKIEDYWELMSRDRHFITDDQANINFVLETLGIRWMNAKKKRNIDEITTQMYGVCKNYMIVMLMPETIVCRYVCKAEEKEKYFVWHTYAIKENRTVENKMTQAKVGSAWFLREDWHKRSLLRPDFQGTVWLRDIAAEDLLR